MCLNIILYILFSLIVCYMLNILLWNFFKSLSSCSLKLSNSYNNYLLLLKNRHTNWFGNWYEIWILNLHMDFENGRFEKNCFETAISELPFLKNPVWNDPCNLGRFGNNHFKTFRFEILLFSESTFWEQPFSDRLFLEGSFENSCHGKG